MSETSIRIKRSRGDWIYDTISYVVLTLILLIVAYPLYFVLIASISDPAKVGAGEILFWPAGLNFDGYKAVFDRSDVVRSFVNSLFYTVLGTAINIAVTIPCAFALSRPMRGKKWFMLYFTIPMFISGGMIPGYLVVRNLGLLNTVWSLVLPGAISIYNMIIARTFFQTTIEQGLIDAAKIDGCGNTRFFFKIALPLSHAIIAIMVLYYGVGHWNSYFNAMIYLTDADKFPLQLVLRTILVQNAQQTQQVADVEALQRQQDVAELMKYSLIVVSTIPVLILYPFIQKHFVKGVMIGSLKG